MRNEKTEARAVHSLIPELILYILLVKLKIQVKWRNVVVVTVATHTLMCVALSVCKGRTGDGTDSGTGHRLP